MLTEFAEKLQATLRKHDTLARYGGEEFVVILPEAEEAVIVAEKLRAAIDETVFNDGREKYRVTASFGQTSSNPSTEDAFEKITSNLHHIFRINIDCQLTLRFHNFVLLTFQGNTQCM